jgi:hypothetical protein
MQLSNGAFERQERYVVIKMKDMFEAVQAGFLGMSTPTTLIRIMDSLEAFRLTKGRPPLLTAVVEEDWPEYEVVWAMIEQRMKETSGEQPPAP